MCRSRGRLWFFGRPFSVSCSPVQRTTNTIIRTNVSVCRTKWQMDAKKSSFEPKLFLWADAVRVVIGDSAPSDHADDAHEVANNRALRWHVGQVGV